LCIARIEYEEEIREEARKRIAEKAPDPKPKTRSRSAADRRRDSRR
jgi:hypothetical protein